MVEDFRRRGSILRNCDKNRGDVVIDLLATFSCEVSGPYGILDR